MAQHPHIWVLLPRPVVLIVEENADVPAILRIHLEQESGDEHGFDTGSVSLGAENEPVILEVVVPQTDGAEPAAAIESTPGAGSGAYVRIVPTGAEGETGSSIVSLLNQLKRGFVDRSPRVRSGQSRTRRITPSSVARQFDDEVFFRRVTEAIEVSLGDSRFTVDRLADDVGMSVRQLERRLRAICGVSPSELVRRHRLSRARELLRANAGSVSEIMFSVGYRSSSNFAAAFRRMFGRSPSDCRKSCRLS